MLSSWGSWWPSCSAPPSTLPPRGGAAAAAANVFLRGDGGGEAFLADGRACEAAGAGVVGFSTVESGEGDGGGGGVSWPPAPEGAGACGGSGEEGGAWTGTSGILSSLDTAGAGGWGEAALGLGTVGAGGGGRGGGGGALTRPQIFSNSSCCWRDLWGWVGGARTEGAPLRWQDAPWLCGGLSVCLCQTLKLV